jgi:hypothetical protein
MRWSWSIYLNRLRFGNAAIEGASRISICTFAPGESKRYLAPLIGPATVIAVGPVYSKRTALDFGCGRFGAADVPPAAIAPRL